MHARRIGFTERSTRPRGFRLGRGASAPSQRSRRAATRAGFRSWSAAPELYLRALIEGLAPTPPIPNDVHRAARVLHAELGPAAFHDALRRLDPEAAARLGQTDTQRVLRAYEVATATGRTLGAWQRDQASSRAFSACAIVLLPPRAPLYAACDARFLDMLAHGAAEEVKALLDRGLDPSLPAMRALGVRELRSLA